MQNISVCGIHTEIGKTAVSAALCSQFGYSYFKLIQAGSEHDSNRVASLAKSAGKSVHIHSNGVSLNKPASPHIASRVQGVNYDALSIALPASSGVLVELAGGLYTPLGGGGLEADKGGKLNKDSINLKPNIATKGAKQSLNLSGGFMIDYLAAHSLPTFLVCADYLGAINHTILSLNALHSRGIKVLGVIISGEDRVLGEFLNSFSKHVFKLPKFLSDSEFGLASASLAKQIKKAGII